MKAKGKELRIRNFPDELLRELRVEAAQRWVSLRNLVIRKLSQRWINHLTGQYYSPKTKETLNVYDYSKPEELIGWLDAHKDSVLVWETEKRNSAPSPPYSPDDRITGVEIITALAMKKLMDKKKKEE